MHPNSSVRHTRLSAETENNLAGHGAASICKKAAEGGTGLRMVLGAVRRHAEEGMTQVGNGQGGRRGQSILHRGMARAKA